MAGAASKTTIVVSSTLVPYRGAPGRAYTKDSHQARKHHSSVVAGCRLALSGQPKFTIGVRERSFSFHGDVLSFRVSVPSRAM
eukprot:1186400-Prorocentrum_minimum.AAC.1